MAANPKEQQIIDAHEAGLSIGEIAAQLGLTLKYVRHRVCELATGNGQYIAAMKQGSDDLRDSVLAARAVS